MRRFLPGAAWLLAVIPLYVVLQVAWELGGPFQTWALTFMLVSAGAVLVRLVVARQ